MPGLFGIWKKERDLVPADWLEDYASLMQHEVDLRIESHTFDGFAAGCVHLGYFQQTCQPAIDATERYSLWFDGELTNRTRLVELLCDQKEHVHNDSALSLELYLSLGWDFLDTADGVFVLALYDKVLHKLTLVNDRLGLRPLYWVQAPGVFAFAGEVKSLLRAQGVATRIDEMAVKEYFSFGHMLEQRTWIDGINQLSSATILEMSLAGVSSRQYWHWSDIKPMPVDVSADEVIDGMGHLFIEAVANRVDDLRIGQLLSGGLDSRAILAAVPQTKQDYSTLAFGTPDSLDVKIAREASSLKGVPFHYSEINAVNWIRPRIDAIWRTDGLCRILDMHGMESLPLMSRAWQVNLSGFIGDVVAGASQYKEDTGHALNKILIGESDLGMDLATARSYLQGFVIGDDVSIDATLIQQRSRRFVNTGLIGISSHVESRMPFVDYAFLSHCFSMPIHLRKDSFAYRKMLIRCFPQFFVELPWQKTGMPIWPSPLQKLIMGGGRFLERSVRYAARSAGVPVKRSRLSYTDYSRWLRQGPARVLVTSLLLDKNRISAEYLDPEKSEGIVSNFLETDSVRYLRTVGLLLTFEIYLKQLFDKERFDNMVGMLYPPTGTSSPQ